MECMRAKKKCIAVVNESLMDNHQNELVSALSKKGLIVKSSIA
ncbi:hypothetical protein O9G_005157 [Rozella allomycis CSF55]|uniref:N-acetylglucosaminyldiphosphodolichol N-acetylglucosaminyltransferase n=1 Tax=Rozella allomycis (strain CSF55) TaxID=988480 RepID=A0A075AVE7_ROZAC|nr:hypothetical protein O9G_005157 [Rozella allomycis CSF55]|eukprot:EPZ34301.1 hypothetical protein O9G_005157 [Rozella allomycis CSF55]